MMSVVKHWNRLPTEMVDVQSLDIQGQVRRGSKQCDLVEDVPARCRGDWTRWPPTQTILYDKSFEHWRIAGAKLWKNLQKAWKLRMLKCQFAITSTGCTPAYDCTAPSVKSEDLLTITSKNWGRQKGLDLLYPSLPCNRKQLNVSLNEDVTLLTAVDDKCRVLH